MQVVISRCSGSFRCGDQRREPPDVTQRACQGCLLDPRDSCPIQLSKLQLVDLAEHRHHNIALPQLDGEPGSGEQASAVVSRLAELRRASHRGYGHRDRTPSPRP